MTEPEIYEPALFGFRDLFYGSTDAESRSDQEGRFGFHDGASVLLTGGPGSGKTTFAFACARDLLFRYRKDGLLRKIRPDRVGVDRLYYISLEVNRDRLKRMYREMGWMREDDQLFRGGGSLSCLHEFVPEFSEDRPPPTPEETLEMQRIFGPKI